MRLLCCNHCKTIEEVPDYEGTDEVDPLIEELVRQHNVRDPMAHGGRNLPSSPLRIANVSDDEWNRNRKEVLKAVNAENKKVGFDAWVEESMNTYAEDALRCYSDHHRPKDGCMDYWADSKRIGRPTAEGRAVVRSLHKLGKKDPHLCQWCPVHTFVQTEANWRAGLYG